MDQPPYTSPIFWATISWARARAPSMYSGRVPVDAPQKTAILSSFRGSGSAIGRAGIQMSGLFGRDERA